MDKIIEFGDWQQTDRILSLGCGAGWWEVNLIHQKPALELILVDYNESVLNQPDFEETLIYFEKQYGQRSETNFQLNTCDASDTRIASETVGQIWILNSLHEMDDQIAVLAECHRVLSSKGTVIVEEVLASRPGEIHAGCGKFLFARETLLGMFEEAGFLFVSEIWKDTEAHYLKFQK
jgi:ubiquinone/menaquinone biosynthesis C-methylase UbiE